MSLCPDGNCPARLAMSAIRDGGFCEPGRCRTLVVVNSFTNDNSAKTGGGSGGSSTTYMASESAFRAAIAKMEVARAQMQKREYTGDLLALSGQTRILGVCYLLSMRESILTGALRDLLNKHNAGELPVDLAVDLCGTYPDVLHETINKLIAQRAGMLPLQPPPCKLSTIVTGKFARAGNGKDWQGLQAIADDLLELSKVCSDIEIYHLYAVEKITELMATGQWPEY